MGEDGLFGGAAAEDLFGGGNQADEAPDDVEELEAADARLRKAEMGVGGNDPDPMDFGNPTGDIPEIIREIEEYERGLLKAMGLDEPEEVRGDQVRLDAYLDSVMEKAGVIQGEMDQRVAAMKARMQIVKEFCEEENRKSGIQLEWLRQKVRHLTERGYVFPKGKKSMAMAFGTFGKKKKQDAVDVVDDEVAVKWIEGQEIPDGVKVEKKVVKNPVKKFLKEWDREKVDEETGEVVPLPSAEECGMVFIPGRDFWFLDLKKPRL